MQLGRFLAVTAGLALFTGAAACSSTVVAGLVTGAVVYAGFRGLFVRDISVESRQDFKHPQETPPILAVPLEHVMKEAQEIIDRVRKERNDKPCSIRVYKNLAALSASIIHQKPTEPCYRQPALFYSPDKRSDDPDKCHDPVYEYHTHAGKTAEGHPCTAICTPVGYAIFTDDSPNVLKKSHVPHESFRDGGDMYIDNKPVYLDKTTKCLPPTDVDGFGVSEKEFGEICTDHFQKNPPVIPAAQTTVVKGWPSAKA